MLTQAQVDFLKSNQWSSFYRSLLTQYESRRNLSQKQIDCIDAAMNKRIEVKQAPKDFSINLGQVIEVKAWIARRLQADLNMSYFFRNLEVSQVLNETGRAYQVKVKFVSHVVTSCHICGRELDTEVSRACGIGPVCADKLGLPRPTLATAQQTLQALDALCNNIGEVGPVWIPKSQIKAVA